MRFIRLEHELTHAEYDEKTGKWHFRIRRPAMNAAEREGGSSETGAFEEIEDSADLFISATGYVSFLAPQDSVRNVRVLMGMGE